MLKSKYLISIVLVFFILFVGWKGVNHIIGNDKFSKIKSIIPEKHQTFIKKYFFVDKFTRDLVSKYNTLNESNELNEKIKIYHDLKNNLEKMDKNGTEDLEIIYI